MNASELIELLRRHPKATDTIGLVVMQDDVTIGGEHVMSVPVLVSKYDTARTIINERTEAGWFLTCAIRYVLGAAVEKCDELGIAIKPYKNVFLIVGPSQHWMNPTQLTHKPTRLEACLAALESSTESETT